MPEYKGWLLDLYAMPGEGAVFWLLCSDGQRRRLRQPFPVTFYAAGPPERLRQLWRYLRSQPAAVQLARKQRRDLFAPTPVAVLAATVSEPADQPELFERVARIFPELIYYDADLPLPLRHAAQYGSFPLAYCRVQANEKGEVQWLEVLDRPWELDPEPVPLRVLSLQPDVDPNHAAPHFIELRIERYAYRLALNPPRPLLINLNAILARHDPDILLSMWGDTWLLPHLLELSERLALALPLNRDPACAPLHKRERSYFTYGQIVHRGRQVHLFGRVHIDAHNAMLFHDYGLEGVFELSRVTSLPLQTVARVSPGSGISAMQMTTALRHEVLVPWRKQQAEQPKTALQLLRADMGGLVYQPTLGLHSDVAELDFVSMYPSIMAHYNISPETVLVNPVYECQTLPSLESVDEQCLSCPAPAREEQGCAENTPGLIPLTLLPLLNKRMAIKARQVQLAKHDPRRLQDKARSSAHKWLLVTCFGYLGYKNARFGRIEAHEAVTAHGRDALLRAKEAAEDLGFEVLHMYVDGLWVRRLGMSQPNDFQPLLKEITARTGLPISLEGVYRWVAFLPSRVDRRIPVANRYFGVFQDGSLKLRGIEARRGDTCAWVAKVQTALLEHLAQAESAARLSELLPGARCIVQSALDDLRRERVPLHDLVVSLRLSRELQAYRSPSLAARAAAQLARLDKPLRPGQRVRFLITRGEPGVHAWDLPEQPPYTALDVARYRELLLRAARSVLEPLGAGELLEPAHPLQLPLQNIRWLRLAGQEARGVLPEL